MLGKFSLNNLKTFDQKFLKIVNLRLIQRKITFAKWKFFSKLKEFHKKNDLTLVKIKLKIF